MTFNIETEDDNNDRSNSIYQGDKFDSKHLLEWNEHCPCEPF